MIKKIILLAVLGLIITLALPFLQFQADTTVAKVGISALNGGNEEAALVKTAGKAAGLLRSLIMVVYGFICMIVLKREVKKELKKDEKVN